MNQKKMLSFRALQKSALDRVEGILDNLKIEWVQRSPERINIICPVHQSTDLASACIYLTNGNYKCWSRGCESQIGSNFVHLIKWALSQNGEASWEDVEKFIECGGKITNRPIINRDKIEITYMDPSKYPSVTIPCPYYIDRGFSPESLTKFGIGLTQQFPYTGRSLVPIKSEDNKLMGFSGRSIYDKCSKCNFYHSKYQTCISKDYEYAHMFNKWYHSSGLKKTLTLYGIEHIGQTNKIAIVEGPSCVWRLDEFAIPAVAVLGRTFSRHQADILKRKGIQKIFLLTDEDEAGQGFKKKFITDWYNTFQIYITTLPKKDVSEMSNEEIEKIILKKWGTI